MYVLKVTHPWRPRQVKLPLDKVHTHLREVTKRNRVEAKRCIWGRDMPLNMKRGSHYNFNLFTFVVPQMLTCSSWWGHLRTWKHFKLGASATSTTWSCCESSTCRRWGDGELENRPRIKSSPTSTRFRCKSSLSFLTCFLAANSVHLLMLSENCLHSKENLPTFRDPFKSWYGSACNSLTLVSRFTYWRFSLVLTFHLRAVELQPRSPRNHRRPQLLPWPTKHLLTGNTEWRPEFRPLADWYGPAYYPKKLTYWFSNLYGKLVFFIWTVTRITNPNLHKFPSITLHEKSMTKKHVMAENKNKNKIK